ncbi:MAG: hypothetical protein OEW17_08810 [Gemmatimonadota bacterium]|nr:hypothetical protein [Gemmatimonadota bacterium]MDH5284420.1 hypothetical protein [Gemmatimonadota bacterium]
MTRMLLPLLGVLLVAGCQDTIVKSLGPANNEQVKLLPDTLRFQAGDLDNVFDTRAWSLPMSSATAKVRHRTFVHHGEARVTIADAAGDTVYRQVPLEYELDDVTLAGQPGVWTVTLEFIGARGRVDFTVRNKP